jgi:hypothetical protein
MATIVYNRFYYDLCVKLLNLSTDTIKVQLHTASYTPDKDHDVLADLSAEVANGNGYATGGATLASKTVTQDDANDCVVLDAADTEWTASTITARYVVLVDTTHDTLIVCFDLGGNVSSIAGSFKITWSASGYMTFSQG